MKTIRTINIAFILAALLLIGVPATSGMADVFSATRALPGGNLHPGDTFNVTVSFSAPADDLNAIGITDVAPTGWAISVNTAWCTPAATYGNNPETNKVEYTWFGTYSSGTSFTVVYKVTVPGDASDGTYSFTGGQVEYYLGGTGPHFANTTSDTEVTIACTGSTESDSGIDNTGVTSLDGYINYEGEFIADTSVESEDGLVRITFPKGMIYKASNGRQGYYISIKKQDPPSSAPADAAFVCLTYDIIPNGSTFAPHAYLTFFYSDSMVQPGVAEENLVIVTLQDGIWVPLEGCVVDPDKNTITVPLTHLSVFTVIAYTAPASFVASEMTITPSEVNPNEDITISVTITNAGDLTDNYAAALKIDGMSDQTQEVTLKGGESQTVTFTVKPTAVGSYAVELDGLLGEFTVKEPESEGTVAEVPAPEAPAPEVLEPSPTPTETKPSMEAPVTSTQPAETPEIPNESPTTTPSQGIAWRFIVVYVVSAVLVAGVILAYVLMRRSSRK